MNKSPFEILREHLFSDLRQKKQPLEQSEIDNAMKILTKAKEAKQTKEKENTYKYFLANKY